MPVDIVHGTGYRIGTSDREVGAATSAPDDFIVLNLTNGKVFIATGGLWTLSGSPFPASDFNDWLAS